MENILEAFGGGRRARAARRLSGFGIIFGIYFSPKRNATPAEYRISFW